jgi:SAM-dependent methyltransferase
LFLDASGRPCFISEPQMKGLAETGDFSLMAGAMEAGYTATVAETLFREVATQLSSRLSGPVDIMELGGGDGSLFGRFAAVARSYINVEPGEVGLDVAVDERYCRIRCSAEDIPLPSFSVDGVVSVASLDHVPNVECALREIERLLRPGGVFVLVLNNRGSWWKRLLWNTPYGRRRAARIAREHFFQWSLADATREVNRFLRVEIAYTRTHLPFVPYLWRIALPVSNVIGQSLAPRLGANTILVATKPISSTC